MKRILIFLIIISTSVSYSIKLKQIKTFDMGDFNIIRFSPVKENILAVGGDYM